MLEVLILIVAALVIWAIAKSVKAMKNAKVIADENHFKQADVEVEFRTGKIRIKNHDYTVNQVTGISAEPYTNSHKHGASKGWKAIIEVDDFKKPRHEMVFMSRKKANEFTQRLCTALRKAGGPSFN